MRHRSFSLSRFLPVICLLMAAPAFAHHLPPGLEEVDEFADGASFLMGFNHSLTGLDHLLTALLTGMVAARFAKTGCLGVLATAMGGMLAGGLVAQLPAGEAMLLVSVVAAVGIAFFRSARAQQMGAGALVLFQVWHGNAHAIETPFTAARGFFLAGAGMATLLTMILGLALTLVARRWMPAQQGKVQTA
jgi:hydrogenase/urease accessory protein HupE